MARLLRSLALFINELFPFLREVFIFLSGRTFFGLYRYIASAMEYSRKNNTEFRIAFSDFHPCLNDYYSTAGYIPRHYFLQDLWAAKKVFQSGTRVHHDVGSRLDGFIAQCLPFTRVVMFDVRPLDFKIENLDFIQVDFTKKTELPSDSITSISSLHAVEHFGLGRYGDPVDPIGYHKAIDELMRIVAPGGDIYFSVPVGAKRLIFNAHRIFDPEEILRFFSCCKLVEFSVITDEQYLILNANPRDYSKLTYGCGLYHFKK